MTKAVKCFKQGLTGHPSRGVEDSGNEGNGLWGLSSREFRGKHVSSWSKDHWQRYFDKECDCFCPKDLPEANLKRLD